jgi:L-lactate dehydrogenase
MSSGGTTPGYRASDLLAFGGGAGCVRQTGFSVAACRRNSPAPGVAAVRLPGEQALARRRHVQSAGIHLYPRIMDALARWGARFDVVAPAG